MNAFTARLLVVGLAAFWSSPLAAQLAANPVYFSPKGPTGLTLAADFGTTLSSSLDGIDASNKPNHVGLRAILGIPMLTVGLGAGVYSPDVAGEDKETQFAGTLAFKIFSPPLVPIGIAVQAGAGFLQVGEGAGAFKTMDVPVGLGVAVRPPTPGISIEAWAAPRVQLRRVSFGGNSATQTGVGASAGVNLGMPVGLGLHLGADWSRHNRKTQGTLNLGESESIVFGVGLHYTFTIPGLPMVPMI